MLELILSLLVTPLAMEPEKHHSFVERTGENYTFEANSIEETTLHPSHVRLLDEGRFVCSAVVIAKSHVLTADHCITLGEEVEISSHDGRYKTKAIAVSRLARQDVAVLVGDFSRFQSASFNYKDPLFQSEESDIVTCGYPYGSRIYSCFEYTATGNLVVREMGLGRMYFGMSGGPVIDRTTGNVIGVNSAVGNGFVVVSPLVGLDLLIPGLR